MSINEGIYHFSVVIALQKENCALVLGGYVNGYSIIQELFEKGVEDIILFDTSKKIAAYSNKIKKFFLIEKSPEKLYEELVKLHNEYEKIVIFPTDDLQLEYLNLISDRIVHFCFLPFNIKKLTEYLDKYVQYQYCEILEVPYPKTLLIQTTEDIQKISSIQYPLLIKPNKREDLKTNLFRNLKISSADELQRSFELLSLYLSKGVSFLVSEIVPGDGSNVYAYVGYRTSSGKIVNEWTGKKLSQYPDDFGVFSSASNEAPDVVLQQGRTLLNGMDLVGIAEPEFKYDFRDKKFKLTEINLRSMMWHRIGNLSGVNIQYSQYLDALGLDVTEQSQNKAEVVHFVYLKHEIVNLFTRKGYYKIFYRNLFSSHRTCFAVLDKRDIKPFLVDCKDIFIELIIICLNSVKNRLKNTKQTIRF